MEDTEIRELLGPVSSNPGDWAAAASAASVEGTMMDWAVTPFTAPAQVVIPAPRHFPAATHTSQAIASAIQEEAAHTNQGETPMQKP